MSVAEMARATNTKYGGSIVGKLAKIFDCFFAILKLSSSSTTVDVRLSRTVLPGSGRAFFFLGLAYSVSSLPPVADHATCRRLI